MNCGCNLDEAKIAQIAARYKDEPDNLMSILLETQSVCGNSIPRKAAAIISGVTGIPEAKIYGYTTFYSVFSNEERGKNIIRMCKSAPCHVKGAKDVANAISNHLGVEPGETTKDGMFTLEFCECLGLCDKAPAIMINDKVYTDLTPESAVEAVKSYTGGAK